MWEYDNTFLSAWCWSIPALVQLHRHVQYKIFLPGDNFFIFLLSQVCRSRATLAIKVNLYNNIIFMSAYILLVLNSFKTSVILISLEVMGGGLEVKGVGWRE